MKFEPFTKKQMALLTWWTKSSPFCSLDAIICDGAIRSGKSLCMFISFITWAMHSYNESSFAVCARTMSSARRNLITPMLPVLSELGYSCNLTLSKNMFTVKYQNHTNSFYIFGGKDESSASLIQGMTLAGVMLDEVALMPRSFVEQALARCSIEGSKFWFNCNPDNPSHWFYNEWIKKTSEKNVLYLHFLMSENPSLSPKMIKRYESLYSGAFYERFVLGKWVAAQGAVYPFFGKSCMGEPPSVCTKFYVSCDYGTVNPTSFGLWGYCDGIWYRCREFYYSSKISGSQLTDEEYYLRLKELCGDHKISAIVCDPSAASFIACIKRHGEFFALPAKNDVIDGIRKVSDALKIGKIKIAPTCMDSIREFALYRWDSSAAGDCVKKENDHAMDDIRYFVATVLYNTQFGGFAACSVRRQ